MPVVVAQSTVTGPAEGLLSLSSTLAAEPSVTCVSTAENPTVSGRSGATPYSEKSSR